MGREGGREREREKEGERGRRRGNLCSNSSNTDQLDKGLITTFSRKNNCPLQISMFINYTACIHAKLFGV